MKTHKCWGIVDKATDEIDIERGHLSMYATRKEARGVRREEYRNSRRYRVVKIVMRKEV